MISDLVGTFTDPIIVFPGGWGDTLPDWIKTQIALERLAENMKAATGSNPPGPMPRRLPTFTRPPSLRL